MILKKILFTLTLNSMVLLLTTGSSYAQITGHDSLTEDFAKANPKERAKIAKKEAKESANDEEYQATMQKAEKAFQDKRYEDALELFKHARDMRPYNVYPKVKIDDLRTLLGISEEPKSDPPAEKVEPEKVLTPQEIQNPEVVEPGKLTEEQLEVNSVPLEKTAPPKDRIVKPPLKGQEGNKAQRNTTSTDPAMEKAPNGTIERVFKDGSRMVIERTVTRNGRTVVYRRVAHSWGEVHYFQNERSITTDQWFRLFGDE